MVKQRLDRLLVDTGLAESREKAQALIMAGEVLIDGQKAAKPGQMVAIDARIEVTARPRYVSRGGLKLEGALTEFGIDAQGKVCADFGSSTGGFTDCLLQAGAVRVHAIDVGTAQLDWKLRSDARVAVHENMHGRDVTKADLGEEVDLAVCDVSFISATQMLPAMLRVLKQEGGELVILVKPQFEVGRGQVGKGGIVRDPELHRMACDKVRAAVEAAGIMEIRMMESPITGAEGNREFLLYGHR